MEEPSSLFEKFHVLTLDFRTPIVASILYVLLVSYFGKVNREREAAAVAVAAASSKSKRSSSRIKTTSVAVESRFTPFKCFVIAHNVFLCLYSATVFLSALPLLARPYFTNSILEAYCDVQKTTFNSGVNFWVWNFYVSKYYELMDTAILLLKGKPSSFLQTFHHSGSIMGMWVMTTTHAPAGWIFVLFNSFIHTIMYFYYVLTCLGYRPTWKRILTTMQIVQFCVGNPLGLIYAILPDCLPLEIIPPENIIGKILGSQLYSLYACLFINTFFISSLVILFTDFSRKTYGPKKTEAVSSKEKKSTKTAKAVKSEVEIEIEEDSKPVKVAKTIKVSKIKETKDSAVKESVKASKKDGVAVKTSKKEDVTTKSEKKESASTKAGKPSKKTSAKESVAAPITTTTTRRSRLS